ncbi:Crp/Fnr family transcriptional regulator [Amaricoccus sp.]|uniref:Crp/Fnr family transcriptional regulator n=1 Tax=Amaricoccus sp. TaxID=1872485 RepID=UPI00261D17D9|nr:Crp/Fnr family transcriptional regulator [Amaricoccus sp.]HRO10289.1 Crp/Fnr family transcriptional regulator [Amaricoccus sp.]
MPEVALRDVTAESPILSTATQELRRLIEDTAVRTTLGAGEVLFSQGDPGDAVYVVEKGEIEISVHSLDGRKLALDIQRPGEVFGEIALFGGDRTATATALTHSVLRRIRRADVLEALRHRPELALEFIDLLCERLRALSLKLEERSFLPVPVRLASRLLYLDGKLAAAGGGVAVSQADLADFVGATREAVARTLAVWRGRNWVALSRGSVRILDRAELEAIATSFRE